MMQLYQNTAEQQRTHSLIICVVSKLYKHEDLDAFK